MLPDARFMEILRGEIGYEQIETNVDGRIIGSLGRIPAKPGVDLRLSIDADLQRATVGATKTVPGLGLWPGVIVDQHFLKRQRHSRLLSLGLEHPSLVGVGIDEDTAVVVSGSRFEVLGEVEKHPRSNSTTFITDDGRVETLVGSLDADELAAILDQMIIA